jgi:hypothetical protein
MGLGQLRATMPVAKGVLLLLLLGTEISMPLMVLAWVSVGLQSCERQQSLTGVMIARWLTNWTHKVASESVLLFWDSKRTLERVRQQVN